MDRRVFMGLTAASVLQPDAALAPLSPGGQADAAPLDSQAAAFQAWLHDFQIRAIAAGWPSDLVTRETAGLTVNPKVVELDTRQPEFVKSTSDYVRSAVSPDRIQTGRRRMGEVPELADIEGRFGVPSNILTAVWAQESAFGAFQGDMDVIRSLASLASDGRRREWAETQIFAALRMIQGGAAARRQMRGSWAGAMGQTQLIPEVFLTTAVDGDGDGRIDIWNSPADAPGLGGQSAGQGRVAAGGGWAREVTLPPGFDYGLAEGPKQTPDDWALRGVRRTGQPGAPRIQRRRPS